MIQPHVEWPDGKSFAFTVFDDTDRETIENAPPVYNLLADLGFRTTKSVWPIKGPEVPLVGGATCEDAEYLNWVLKLKDQGFEIALHNVTYHTSPREETQRGFERFQQFFGGPPSSMANHTGCLEGIYWGASRLTAANAFMYNLLTRFKNRGIYQGHVDGSPLFWGDICRRSIKYVRNFVFADINTLKACPFMPYHDRLRPYVNHWFAGSEGYAVDEYVRTIAKKNQDRLEAEGAACIMYTHFGKRFFEEGRLHPEFTVLMKRLARKNGWFVPVTTLLDHLLKVKGRHDLTDRDRGRLERKWLVHKVRVGGTS